MLSSRLRLFNHGFSEWLGCFDFGWILTHTWLSSALWASLAKSKLSNGMPMSSHPISNNAVLRHFNPLRGGHTDSIIRHAGYIVVTKKAGTPSSKLVPFDIRHDFCHRFRSRLCSFRETCFARYPDFLGFSFPSLSLFFDCAGRWTSRGGLI